ncbi:hypothetical protein D3C87_1922670 [compost metagenome]
MGGLSEQVVAVGTIRVCVFCFGSGSGFNDCPHRLRLCVVAIVLFYCDRPLIGAGRRDHLADLFLRRSGILRCRLSDGSITIEDLEE